MKYICLGYMEPDKFETRSESERNPLLDDRRVTEPEKNANQLDIEFETGRAAARWIRAMERFDPVELFLYSLTSAAALSAVLMGFLCMADFARQSASEASVGGSNRQDVESSSSLKTHIAKLVVPKEQNTMRKMNLHRFPLKRIHLHPPAVSNRSAKTFHRLSGILRIRIRNRIVTPSTWNSIG